MHTLVNSVRWNEAFVLAGHLPHREGERRGTDTCPLKLIYVGTKTELVRAFYAPEGFPVGLFLQPTQEGNDTRYHNIQYCFIVWPLENWSYLLCNLSWLEYDIKTFFGGTWKVLAHFFFPSQCPYLSPNVFFHFVTTQYGIFYLQGVFLNVLPSRPHIPLLIPILLSFSWKEEGLGKTNFYIQWQMGLDIFIFIFVI